MVQVPQYTAALLCSSPTASCPSIIIHPQTERASSTSTPAVSGHYVALDLSPTKVRVRVLLSFPFLKFSTFLCRKRLVQQYSLLYYIACVTFPFSFPKRAGTHAGFHDVLNFYVLKNIGNGTRANANSLNIGALEALLHVP